MPRQRAPSLPQGRWRRTLKAGRRTKPRPHKRKRMRGGISRNLPWPCRRARSRASRRGRTGEGRGNRPAARAEGRRGRAQAPAATRKGIRGASASRISSEEGKLRPSLLRKGNRRGFGLDASPGDGTASAAPDPPGALRRDFGLARATRRGSAKGFAPLCRDPPGAERGFAASLRDPGESEGGRSRPPRDPKPPSERWPRHPATAVKAGTSGGRWRHRPPL
jgi:hypothetical protein